MTVAEINSTIVPLAERLKNAEERIAQLEEVVFALSQERFFELACIKQPEEAPSLTIARGRVEKAMGAFCSSRTIGPST